MEFIDLTGQVFGRLTVLSYQEKRWLCRCECGAEKLVTRGQLRSGGTQSCGCWKSAVARNTMLKRRKRGRIVASHFNLNDEVLDGYEE